MQCGATRTQEQQSHLLAKAAYRVWEQWCRTDSNNHKMVGVQGQDEEFDQAMRLLFQQISENDVFYSGIHSVIPKDTGGGE